MTVDGRRLWACPNDAEAFPRSHVTWIRQDWLDKLGLEDAQARWMNSPNVMRKFTSARSGRKRPERHLWSELCRLQLPFLPDGRLRCFY